MKERALNALQVAALLVSASYGIGFLFGSGEMALAHGMAGGLYGVATGAGMIVMAFIAGRLWRVGLPVWDLFGQQYGHGTRRAVALLSLVWMAGVLAAQIQGGLALVGLAGVEAPSGFLLVVGLIYAASRLDLRRMSRCFPSV